MISLEREGHFQVADDLDLASRIVKKLTDHYPDHLWGVLFDEDGGVVRICCETVQHPIFTNRTYAYTLKLSRFDTDPDLKSVMRAGGEILERARIHRGRWNGEYPTHVDGVKNQYQPLLDKDGGLLLWR